MKNDKIITVIGSYAVGLTMHAKRLPVVGETLIGNGFVQIHGGKGSNQAVACSRLGANVDFYTCVGQDILGKNAVNMLNAERVNGQKIKISQCYSTGAGFVIVFDSGDNSILIDFGANNDISEKDIDGIEDMIASSSALLLQLEINLSAVYRAIYLANKHHVPVILNPAPYQNIDQKILRLVDIITPNASEAKLLLGIKPEEKVHPLELCKTLFEKGIKNIVLTLGESGAFVYNDSIRKPIDAIKVDALDTTGAGDTFNAALCVGLTEGMQLEDAVKFAVVSSGLSVQKFGVVESIPKREEVDKVFNNGGLQ